MQRVFLVFAFAISAWFSLFSYGYAATQPLQVKAVNLSSQPDGSEELVIQLSSPVVHRAFILPSPPRIVVDLPPFQWRVDASRLQQYKGKLVQNIRYARFDSQTSRIVLDLQQPVILTALGTTAEGDTPMTELRYRLIAQGRQEVVENNESAEGITPRDMTLELATREKTSPPPNGGPSQAFYAPAAPTQPVTIGPIFAGGTPAPRPKPSIGYSATMSQEMPKKLPLIVIDAGHGGQDPGTIGRSKAQEKNITLSYAHALRDALVATGRFRANLTRSGDTFIMLRERFNIARKQKADLFISLHADSAPSTLAKGLSIYTLSEESSDAEAEALATQENKVDVLADVNLGSQDEEVADILIDLAQRETKNKSIILADHMVDAMRGRVQLLPNTHRYAGFAVLKAPDIPSALIEIGFLSHPEEERKILSTDHRQQVVRGIITGITKYFAEQR